MQLAKNGLGTTAPNPMVGAVVVYQDTIIGEGYTSPYGGNHAEVNAIQSVKNKALLKESTIYVSLEPCSHFGKTPPCSNLIIAHQIPNVVVGCVDDFALVSGNGIKQLQANGCQVIVGILEDECKEMNKRFFTFHNKKRPYIILKWAQTEDGFIAPKNNTQITWISNVFSKQLSHKLRAEEQAILVGTNTVITDNPKLNCRNWNGKNPVRIILDRSLRIPQDYHIFDGSVQTIVITEKLQENQKNILFETIDFTKNIAPQICEVLYKHQIQSVIIEGGAQTIQTFMDSNLWDEAHVFTGNSEFKKGIKAPQIIGKLITERKIKTDTLKMYTND